MTDNEDELWAQINPAQLAISNCWGQTRGSGEENGK